MDAVLLAGGEGLRLRPLTEDTPKPLLPLGNSCALETALVCLRKGGATRVFVAAKYRSDMVKAFVGDGSRWGLDVRVMVEDRPLGTAGPVAPLRPLLRSPFILMNADVLTTLDFGRFYEEGCATRAALTAVTSTVSMSLPYGRITGTGNRIDAVEEKPELQAEVLAGIYLLRDEALDSIPDHRYFGVDELIEKLLQQGSGVHRYAADAYWRDIGRPEDYEAAQREYAAFFNEDRDAQSGAAASAAA